MALLTLVHELNRGSSLFLNIIRYPLGSTHTQVNTQRDNHGHLTPRVNINTTSASSPSPAETITTLFRATQFQRHPFKPTITTMATLPLRLHNLPLPLQHPPVRTAPSNLPPSSPAPTSSDPSAYSAGLNPHRIRIVRIVAARCDILGVAMPLYLSPQLNHFQELWSWEWMKLWIRL